MADGSIRIETSIDNSALKKQAKELKRELENIRKEQAKVDAQADSIMAKYEAEKEFDAQFPAEFSHREDIDKKAQTELDPIIAKQEELNQKEQVYLDKLAAVNAKLTEQANIASASKQVDSEVKADGIVAKIQTQEEYNSLLEATKAKMNAIESAATRIAEKTGLTKEQILAANLAYQKLSDTMGVLTARAGEFGDKAQTAGAKAASGLRTAKKEANAFDSAIKRGIKRVGKMALAVFGIRGAYRAVSIAATTYLATNEKLAGQMEAIKNGFAQVLGPAIEWVVNLLMKAISVVNAFVQALTGINFVARANEAALKKQAKAASSGSGNSTAGFDEQTKLSGGAGGGGSGSAVATLPDGSNIDMSFLDPVVNAFKKFAEDMKPFISTVGDLFKWLYDEVLVPVGEWAVTSLLPAVLGLISSAFGVLNEVLIALQPMALWLWENFLQPIAEWTGGVIIDILTGIADGLTAVSDWVSENQVLVEDFAIVIGSFAAAWGLATVALKLWNAAVAIWNNWGAISTAITWAFGAAVQFLTSPVTLVVLAIGALIAIVVLLVKHWDEVSAAAGKCWEWIKGVWEKVATWFNENIIKPLGKFFSGMWDGLVNGAKAAWKGIQNVFSTVASFFGNIFSKAWEGVKKVFSVGGKIFDGIKDGIISAFKLVVNGIIDGINKVVSLPFKGLNGILDTIQGIDILGVKPFGWMKWRAPIPQLPKLARGGIVNNPGRGVPAIVGEAGAEAILPLENNTEWMDMLAEKIGGNVTIPIYMDGKKIATYVVDIQKKKAFAMNGA